MIDFDDLDGMEPTPSEQDLFQDLELPQLNEMNNSNPEIITNVPVTTSTVTSVPGPPIVVNPQLKQTGSIVMKPISLRSLAPAPGNTSTTSTPVINTSPVTAATSKVSNVQIIRLVTSQAGTKFGPNLKTYGPNLRAIAPNSSKTLTLIPAGGKILPGNIQLGGNTGIFLPPGTTFGSSSGPQVIMLPANLLQQTGNRTISITSSSSSAIKSTVIKQSMAPISLARTNFVPIAPNPVSTSNVHPATKDVAPKLAPKPDHVQNLGFKMPATATSGSDGNRQRKPCNCTKSGCLKLYCECFSNGEFCQTCNCVNCYNNLDHESERNKAVKQCLERNPHAFHPKIGKGRLAGDTAERRHTKGCNCRRSGCLKNYCECYEAKILCSELCKCCACKNYEDSFERKTLQLMNLSESGSGDSKNHFNHHHSSSTFGSKSIWGSDFPSKLPIPISSVYGRNHAVSYITPELIDSTCQCLLAVAEDGEKRSMSEQELEATLMKEFGRCLNQIITCSSKK